MLKQQERALSEYVAGIASQRQSTVGTGYDFRAAQTFVTTGLVAQARNHEARSEGVKARQVAFDRLAAEMQRRDALESSLKAIDASLARLPDTGD